MKRPKIPNIEYLKLSNEIIYYVKKLGHMYTGNIRNHSDGYTYICQFNMYKEQPKTIKDITETDTSLSVSSNSLYMLVGDDNHFYMYNDVLIVHTEPQYSFYSMTEYSFYSMTDTSIDNVRKILDKLREIYNNEQY